MRDSMVFYRSFYEAIKDLPDDQFAACVRAILGYALDGAEPDLEGVAKVAFTMAKPQIDKNNTRYQNGTKGGRPKESLEPNKNQTITKQKPNRNQTKTKPEPNDNVNVNDNVNDNENVNVNDNENVNDNDNVKNTIINVVDYLNSRCGTGYKHTTANTRKLIKARLNDGYTESDFYTVIDKKTDEWLGTEQEKYLRPETLFGPKFESYLNQVSHPKKSIANEWLEAAKIAEGVHSA